MTVRARLKRLTELARRKGYHLDDRGCPACRDRRGRIVHAFSWKAADGRIVPIEGHPAPCPDCGQMPEQVIEVVEAIAERSPENGELVEVPWHPEEA